MARDLVAKALADLSAASLAAANETDQLLKASDLLTESLSKGGLVLLAGNGGSAAEAQHFAGEIVGRFTLERYGLPAIALTADSAILTAIANDYGYEEVFVRQVKALGRPGDVFWGLSTSGRSPNILKALAAASERGLKTIFMRGPLPLKEDLNVDVVINTPGQTTPRIQEIHLFYGHILCEIVEKRLFGGLK
ncbi:MAG: SIS domain-containing protein [Deltaproteobacteria bacterium]|jgi:D-sedoheptulose 7-phosphate isomerase|nr:SIS domain-containing protein [Deltaproteobacteria bacterium]